MENKIIAVFPSESTIRSTVELSELLPPQGGAAVVGEMPERLPVNPSCPTFAERTLFNIFVRKEHGKDYRD